MFLPKSSLPTFSQWLCFRTGRTLSGSTLPPELLSHAMSQTGCIHCGVPVSFWERASYLRLGGRDKVTDVLHYEVLIGCRIKAYEEVDVPLIGGGTTPELRSKVIPVFVKGPACPDCQYLFARTKAEVLRTHEDAERNTHATRQTVTLPGTYDARGIRVPTALTGKRQTVVVPVRTTRMPPQAYLDVMDRVLAMPRASHPKEDVDAGV